MLFLKKRKDTIVVFLIIDMELIYVTIWRNEKRLTKSQTFRLLVALVSISLLYIYIYIYNYYGSSQQLWVKSTIFFFLNSKLKSKIECYQIYLLKNKIREITKTQENFYFFSKTK